MNRFFGVIAASALLAGGAMPALAQDVAAWTCGEFFALDAAGRAEGANAILNFVKDTANAAAVGTAASTLGAATQEDALKAVEVACEGQAVDVNLLSVLK